MKSAMWLGSSKALGAALLATLAIAATACGDDDDGAFDCGDAGDAPDAGEADGGSCEDPLTGVGEACGPDLPTCSCDDVCGTSLFAPADAAQFEGFTCLAECGDGAPCAAEGEGCVALDDGGGACVPLGEVPQADFSVLLWSADHAPQSADIVPVTMTVAAGEKVWTTTWGVAAQFPDPGTGEPATALIFGADPTGVVVRYLYFIVPTERFVEGLLPMFDPDAGSPEAAASFQVYVFEDVYGNGFDGMPTETHYMAFAIDGAIELSNVGAECDVDPDCEPTEGNVQAALLGLHLEVAQ